MLVNIKDKVTKKIRKELRRSLIFATNYGLDILKKYGKLILLNATYDTN